MKKISSPLIIIVIIAIFSSCERAEDSVINELVVNNQIVSLSKNSAATVTIESGNGKYSVASSDANIAKVVVINNTITITGIEEGTATVTLTDSQNKTVIITVTVRIIYSIPTSPKFVWNGVEKDLDIIGSFATTIMQSSAAVTDLFNEKRQFYLSWTGGMIEGDKTESILKIVGENYETETIQLTALRIVQSETSGIYIVFKDGKTDGELFFIK